MLILESAEQRLFGVMNGNSNETGLLLLFLCALQAQGNAFHPVFLIQNDTLHISTHQHH